MDLAPLRPVRARCGLAPGFCVGFASLRHLSPADLDLPWQECLDFRLHGVRCSLQCFAAACHGGFSPLPPSARLRLLHVSVPAGAGLCLGVNPLATLGEIVNLPCSNRLWIARVVLPWLRAPTETVERHLASVEDGDEDRALRGACLRDFVAVLLEGV